MAERSLPATVLYVDHAHALGGAERSLLELLRVIDRRRYLPLLACAEGPLAQHARREGIAVQSLELARLRDVLVGWQRWQRGARALAALAEGRQVQLMHANTFRAAIYTARAATQARCPWVWHVRDFHRYSPIAWWLTRRASAIVANSRAVATALPGGRDAVVIYNPVTPPSPRLRTRAELGLPEGRLVASVGILRPWKGHDRFLSAARHVTAPDSFFLIIGGRIHGDEERNYEAVLQAQAARLGLCSRVRFLGHREDLADIWPHLALLVHAARAEPFGRVAAEALLAGVPVVAFREGGLPEIVDHGESGLLVASDDVRALAAAVDRLLGDEALRQAFGQAGRRRALERFSPRRHAQAMEELYDAVLVRRQHPTRLVS